MAQIMASIGEGWRKIPALHRVLLLAVLLAMAGAGVLLFQWARQPDWAMLYSQLSNEEAGRIVEKIREENVPYDLRDGGTAIYVPAAKVYPLRLSLASQGMPAGDQLGYRILDQEKIGASPFTQRINYTRAIEGELARTISLIEGIAAARVHVVRPEGTIFAAKPQQASATVALKLKPGRRLTPTNVAAIVHLVAGSVESLTADRVIVVDNQGTLLSSQNDGRMARGAGTYLDYKSRVEDYLARKAEDLLVAALGPNRASIRVDATIETSTVSEKMETYDPEKRVITKEEIKSSSTGAPAASEGAAASVTREETSTSEYLVSKTVKEQTGLPGEVTALTVAAFVDLTPPPAADGKPAAMAVTVEQVEEIIKSALGPNSKVKVVNTPFTQPQALAPEVPDAGGVGSYEFYLELARRGSLGLLVIGALIALKIIHGPRKKAAALAISGMAGTANLLTADPAQVDPEALRSHITRALADNPDEVKRLFLSWVESEKEEAK